MHGTQEWLWCRAKTTSILDLAWRWRVLEQRSPGPTVFVQWHLAFKEIKIK